MTKIQKIMEKAQIKKRKYQEDKRSSYLDVFVNHCIGLASRSPDPSTKVGCVIFNDDCQILAQGFNGEVTGGEVRNGEIDRSMIAFKEVPKTLGTTGAEVREHRFLEIKDGDGNMTVRLGISRKMFDAYVTPHVERSEEITKLLKDAESGKGDDHAIHAEMNAIVFSECSRREFRGSIAMVSLMPCPQCYKLLAQVGIKWIIVLSDSGRYCKTLVQALKTPSGPKIITIDRLDDLLQKDYCLPCKVFKNKSKLATFVSNVPRSRIQESVLAEFENNFDINYNSVNIEYHCDDIDKLARVLFRISD